MRAKEFITETINPDILDPRFAHTQEIGDYTYKAFAYEGRPGVRFLRVQAFDGSPEVINRVGDVLFRVNDSLHGGNLESINSYVADEYQKRGIASTMYAYAKMLGNDIMPSKDQLPPGKAMWASWEKSGDAEHLMKEAELDPTGWGGTPQGTDVDYFGFKVQMKPSMFLKLAAPLESNAENPDVAQHMEKGGKIAYPFLDIQEPREWEDGNFEKDARVKSHEGRNRMKKWIQMKGDAPIQVNIFFRGANRRKYITLEMIEKLSQGVFSESGNYIVGPIFNNRVA